MGCPRSSERRARARRLGLAAALVAWSGAAAAEEPPATASPPEPAKDAAPSLKVAGYAHVDWVAYRQSSQDEVDPSGEPLNESRFVVRRARLGLEADRGLLHGSFILDANTIRAPQVRPWNAEVSFKWPATARYVGPAELAEGHAGELYFLATAGLLMTPFGFDVAELERTRPFLERAAVSNALFPQSYDLGVRILGGWRSVNWAFALVNGDPIGERAFPGRDPDESKDLVFRVGAAAPLGDRVRVAGGLSGLSGRGFHKGTPGTKDQLTWRDQNEDGIVQLPELQVVAGSPASPSKGFSRFAMGADLRVEVDVPVVGALALRGEIVRGKNLDRGLFFADPVAAARDLRELGGAVSVTQEVTRWALVGARYDAYDPDADAREQRATELVPRDATVSTWAFMGTFRWDHLRVIAEYDLRKNALGRAPSGAPTTLADDSFTVRAAVGF